MSNKQTAAAFTDTAAARLAGQMIASIKAASQRIKQGPDADGTPWGPEHAGYALLHSLDRCTDDLQDLVKKKGWTLQQTEVPRTWGTRRVKVHALETDDIVNISGRWTEVRDVWGTEEGQDPAEDLGEDHDDVPKIREILDPALPYTRLALRVIDPERSFPHEIVCAVIGFDYQDLVTMQVPAVLHA
ncbi:hypothetical protein AB0H82_11090 [Streptomyces sp. NPDC050732]|uniref:hypothetical protein n=1 Tax=Streptomyces sp. NPDC050732 TaxID=3154632 RepID=UPI0034212D4E